MDSSGLSQTVFFSNSISDYLTAFGIFLAVLIIFRFIRSVFLHRLHQLATRTSTHRDDAVIEFFRSIKPPFYFLFSLYIALQFLSVHQLLNQLVFFLIITWSVYHITRLSDLLFSYLSAGFDAKSQNTPTDSAVSALKLVVKIVIWLLGLLLVLSNLGFDITSLIAGLGIGGIAVALAVQNILGDLLSSFSIYFDKPFQVGDFIVVDSGITGTVKKIGIKTTRIQALQGEEIVVPNHTLTSANIQNFKKLQKRRVVFSFGVTYQTSPSKLAKIPTLVQKIINSNSLAQFDRAHFKEFGDSALIFEVVYYANTRDYSEYMDINQQINLGLVRKFNQQSIDFAYPTQTLYVSKS